MDGTLRVGIVPGVTVSKWSRVWAERMPDTPLEIVLTTPQTQATALRDVEIDMSFVRLPIDDEGLTLIPLWTETAVVVLPRDHEASLFEGVTLADLADERLLDGEVADDIELVAAGVGLRILPQSLAQLHARKDLLYRPVTDAEGTRIALAWRSGDERPELEEFVGIVRGRTARSSRVAGQADAEPAAPAKRTAKAKAKAKEARAEKAKAAPKRPTASSARAAANARRQRKGRPGGGGRG
ncbi:LysR family substrate-binding domain-containing protein [Microbacteriaceae bacterium 4G12]